MTFQSSPIENCDFSRPLLHANFKLKVVCRWDNTSCQVQIEFSGVHFQFIHEHSTQSLHFHSPPTPPLFGLWLIVRVFLLSLWNVNTNSYSSALDMVHFSVQNKTVSSERHSVCFAKRLRAELSSGSYERHYSIFTLTYYSSSGVTASAELVVLSLQKSGAWISKIQYLWVILTKI